MSRLFIFILLITSFLSAQDEYELKDGTIIKGTVVSKTANEIKIKTESGEMIIIMSKIDRLGGRGKINSRIKITGRTIETIEEAEDEEAEDCDNASNDYVDYDGNVYKTVQIGEQVWMAENLRVTHYNDGEPIHTRITGGIEARWGAIPVGMYSDLGDFYLEDEYSEIEADAFGKNYNWYAVDSGKLAGEGWRVPSDEDWKELEAFLGMPSDELDDFGWRGTNQGAKLAGRAWLWLDGSENGEYYLVNDPEFSTTCLNLNPSISTFLTEDLYPRYNDRGNSKAVYWTTTSLGPWTTYQPVERTIDRAIARMIYFGNGEIKREMNANKYWGLQVRLIKD